MVRVYFMVSQYECWCYLLKQNLLKRLFKIVLAIFFLLILFKVLSPYCYIYFPTCISIKNLYFDESFIELLDSALDIASKMGMYLIKEFSQCLFVKLYKKQILCQVVYYSAYRLKFPSVSYCSRKCS